MKSASDKSTTTSASNTKITGPAEKMLIGRALHDIVNQAWYHSTFGQRDPARIQRIAVRLWEFLKSQAGEEPKVPMADLMFETMAAAVALDRAFGGMAKRKEQ